MSKTHTTRKCNICGQLYFWQLKFGRKNNIFYRLSIVLLLRQLKDNLRKRGFSCGTNCISKVFIQLSIDFSEQNIGPSLPLILLAYENQLQLLDAFLFLPLHFFFKQKALQSIFIFIIILI